MENNARKTAILEQLKQDFPDSTIAITDDSAKHSGHAGNQGKGHFSVNIVSNLFENKNRLQRHRMVYQSLEKLLNSDVHALAVKADVPTESK